MCLSFHNLNSKPITHNSNSTIIQKNLILLFGHKTQSCISIFNFTFCQNNGPTHWHYIEEYGCYPRPFSFLLFKPSSTTTNGKPRNPQPPPTTLNTTTTSTKKSEWIKNPNPLTALNQMCLIEKKKKKRRNQSEEERKKERKERRKHQVSSRREIESIRSRIPCRRRSFRSQGPCVSRSSLPT